MHRGSGWICRKKEGRPGGRSNVVRAWEGDAVMADCPNAAQNKAGCKCQSTDCKRRGRCCECIRYHREKGNYPVCLR